MIIKLNFFGGRGASSSVTNSVFERNAKEQTISSYYRRKSIYGSHYADSVVEAADQGG